jgi:hypothetical protein
VSLEKTAILGINTDPDILREITRRLGIQVTTGFTGIQVTKGFRYLSMQLRSTCAESKSASYRAEEEGITAKCDRLNMSHTDLFHKRQLIKSVVIPSFNHIFMSFSFCKEAAR